MLSITNTFLVLSLIHMGMSGSGRERKELVWFLFSLGRSFSLHVMISWQTCIWIVWNKQMIHHSNADCILCNCNLMLTDSYSGISTINSVMQILHFNLGHGHCNEMCNGLSWILRWKKGRHMGRIKEAGKNLFHTLVECYEPNPCCHVLGILIGSSASN